MRCAAFFRGLAPAGMLVVVHPNGVFDVQPHIRFDWRRSGISISIRRVNPAGEAGPTCIVILMPATRLMKPC